MRRLIYKEDNQMYYHIPVVFETDSNLSVEQMRNISYQTPGAGQFSTSFETFKSLMEGYGFDVIEIERYPQSSIPPDNTLEIVVGATGNY